MKDPPVALAVTELTAWGCHRTQPRNSWDQVWVVQLKSALSARSALTSPASFGAVASTTCPGSVYLVPLSVTLPVQMALDSSVEAGAVQAPTALKARLSLMPVWASHATT